MTLIDSEILSDSLFVCTNEKVPFDGDSDGDKLIFNDGVIVGSCEREGESGRVKVNVVVTVADTDRSLVGVAVDVLEFVIVTVDVSVWVAVLDFVRGNVNVSVGSVVIEADFVLVAVIVVVIVTVADNDTVVLDIDEKLIDTNLLSLSATLSDNEIKTVVDKLSVSLGENSRLMDVEKEGLVLFSSVIDVVALDDMDCVAEVSSDKLCDGDLVAV